MRPDAGLQGRVLKRGTLLSLEFGSSYESRRLPALAGVDSGCLENNLCERNRAGGERCMTHAGHIALVSNVFVGKSSQSSTYLCAPLPRLVLFRATISPVFSKMGWIVGLAKTGYGRLSCQALRHSSSCPLPHSLQTQFLSQTNPAQNCISNPSLECRLSTCCVCSSCGFACANPQWSGNTAADTSAILSDCGLRCGLPSTA